MLQKINLSADLMHAGTHGTCILNGNLRLATNAIYWLVLSILSKC